MKSAISCIILDDEPLAVKLIEDYAKKVSHLNIIYAGSDVYKAIDLLKHEAVDLVFLDIQMPELTGMELMDMFGKQHNFIITSAYQEYALDAYSFNVIDFLVKPVTFQRFFKSIEKFDHWRSTFDKGRDADYLLVRADRKHHKIAIDSILYIEGLKDYIRIHMDGEKLIVLEKMKNIIEKLPEGQFMRIHRSYIIPFDKLKVIDGNRIQMQNLEYLPIGETYRKAVAERLDY